MKSYLLLTLCAATLAGCAASKPSVSAGPSPNTSPTPNPPSKTFSESQMVGIYKPEVSFSPRFPKSKVDMVMKSIGDTYLQLKQNNRFAMGGAKATITGNWDIKGQNMYLTAQARNDIPIDQIIKKQKAKGADTSAYEHLKAPAMFRISDDGSQLMSPTPTPDVTVILKKRP